MSDGPGPKITIEDAGGQLTVRRHGTVIAETKRALILHEGSLPPVFYIPIDDVSMHLLTVSEHRTFCPYKGDATYFHIVVPTAAPAQDAVWSYRAPFEAVARIADHVAFYPDTVEFDLAP